MGFFFRNRAVLYALGYDIQFARLQRDRVVSHFDLEHTLQYEEEIIGVSVAMPNELAFDFDDHQVMAIEKPDGSWAPVLSEGF